MSKHRTKQQKIIADLHRKLSLQNATATPSVTLTDLPSVSVKKTHTRPYGPTMTITHIATDLRKTLILTTLIIAFQFLLYFLLRNHIVSIPMVRY